MAIIGPCHVCGTVTELSFEHVPPRSAFNDRPVTTKDAKAVLAARNWEELSTTRGRTQQRGAGAYTLCQKCNNDTGSWYGGAYVDWAYQAVAISERAEVAPSLYHTFQIFPLRVIKQVACMFFSANPPRWQAAHEDTVRFVLNKQHKHLHPKFRIFVYFNRSPMSRQSGVTGLATLGGSGKVYSEISFPPLGYILALSGEPPHEGLRDISFFGRYGYNEWTDVSLRIPVLPVASPLPGDFRPASELYC